MWIREEKAQLRAKTEEREWERGTFGCIEDTNIRFKNYSKSTERPSKQIHTKSHHSKITDIQDQK